MYPQQGPYGAAPAQAQYGQVQMQPGAYTTAQAQAPYGQPPMQQHYPTAPMQASYTPVGYPQQPQYAAPGAAPAPAMYVPVEAPALQLMDNLEAIPGVVVKETTQVVDAVMEAIGGPYEAANKYHIRAMPPGKVIGKTHDEPGAWKPSTPEMDSLAQLFFVEEDSSCCLRVLLASVGGLNLRALKLHFYQGNTDKYLVQRPCKCGGCCCCPLEMTMYQKDGGMLGMVVEDFDNYCARCFDCCCLCISKQKVLVGSTRQSLVHKYSLVNAACCCGRVNNCCGATCCKPIFFIDVVDPSGNLVVAAQKVYGSGEGCADCCRCAFDFSNYLLPFPPKASHQERLLLLTGLLSVEYAYHSRQGGEDNGGDS